MKYLLDTNIFISTIKNKIASIQFENEFHTKDDIWFTSVVVEGELNSFAMQRNWGKRKITEIEVILDKVVITPIKVKKNVEIYSFTIPYSQGKHPTLKLPTSARNMGKNDIWIAATASALDLTLIITDRDFEHLQGVFLDIIFINITNFTNS